jgi:2-polyprenyl-3-methyl-5-hydroxy-6-metoxy-1,4-benzoquinol methylase
MTIRIDPEENEIQALRQSGVDWKHKRVLEIGCGDGRLTVRLARLGAKVHAIDPNAESIRMARSKKPARFVDQIRYSVGDAAQLKSKSESFEIVVFAWSL